MWFRFHFLVMLVSGDDEFILFGVISYICLATAWQTGYLHHEDHDKRCCRSTGGLQHCKGFVWRSLQCSEIYSYLRKVRIWNIWKDTPKGQSEAVNRKGTDNAMTKRIYRNYRLSNTNLTIHILQYLSRRYNSKLMIQVYILVSTSSFIWLFVL